MSPVATVDFYQRVNDKDREGQVAGFTNRGDVDFEYPKGHWIRCQDWCLSLTTPPLTS